jgi:hypothetical protein
MLRGTKTKFSRGHYMIIGWKRVRKGGWFFFSRTERGPTLRRARKPGWLKIQLTSFLIQHPLPTLALLSHSGRGSKPLSETAPTYQPALVNSRQLFAKPGTEYLWRISNPILNTWTIEYRQCLQQKGVTLDFRCVNTYYYAIENDL